MHQHSCASSAALAEAWDCTVSQQLLDTPEQLLPFHGDRLVQATWSAETPPSVQSGGLLV
jgi:hypothetical protein